MGLHLPAHLAVHPIDLVQEVAALGALQTVIETVLEIRAADLVQEVAALEVLQTVIETVSAVVDLHGTEIVTLIPIEQLIVHLLVVVVAVCLAVYGLLPSKLNRYLKFKLVKFGQNLMIFIYSYVVSFNFNGNTIGPNGSDRAPEALQTVTGIALEALQTVIATAIVRSLVVLELVSVVNLASAEGTVRFLPLQREI